MGLYRQVNVDYAVCQAIKSTKADETSGIRLAYDINCQYSINFVKRVQRNPYLWIPPHQLLEFVIGLFHVHGHKEECLSRFAPTFHPGCGVTSGEILESLWSTTNGASKITRNMTKLGRAETLNACMQDNNRRKLQDLGEVHLPFTTCLSLFSSPSPSRFPKAPTRQGPDRERCGGEFLHTIGRGGRTRR